MVKTYWWIWFITNYFSDIWLKMCVLNKYFWSTCCSLLMLFTSKLYFTIQHMPAKNLCFCSKPPFSVFSMQHAACSERMLQKNVCFCMMKFVPELRKKSLLKLFIFHPVMSDVLFILHLTLHLISYIFNLTPQTLHCGVQTIIILTFTADCKIPEKMP